MTSSVKIDTIFSQDEIGGSTTLLHRSIDRFAYGHDASHYLLIPSEVLVPKHTEDVSRIFRAAHHSGRALTFRSGGTSLSGQGVTDQVLIDVRKHFRSIMIEDEGSFVRVQPGATVRQVNTRLAKYRRKLGPDPASEIACTIGGVIANNSSGMACGTEQNSYQTIDSMVLVLPSGTIVDTGRNDAADRLRVDEPEIYEGIVQLRESLLQDPALVAEVRRQFAIKNTMGYGINSFLDFDDPVKILEHLAIGSEGTLAFVAEARFRTVEVLPATSTGLLVFRDLADATEALPGLVEMGFATVELLDATSLRVAQGLSNVPESISEIDLDQHAAFLVEVHAADVDTLQRETAFALEAFLRLPLVITPIMTVDPAARASLWEVRKGLYTAIAGARPAGTTALLEDVAVPVEKLFDTCNGLIELFDAHGYENAVIFGHAKDGNVHFMLTERFDTPEGVERHRRFVEDLVELVLLHGGTLKAEHGTGRVMAPFVRRQYGDTLTDLMWQLKRLLDPKGLLNPGVVLSEQPDSFLQNLKVTPRVEIEVDRCVECGYCEPNCPSKDITLTPRQRIVLRREIATAEANGDAELAAELRDDYEYDGLQTCAVDGMCRVACPVDINTGDLVRRLRAESSVKVESMVWNGAAKHWDGVTQVGGVALSAAKAMPTPLVRGVTHVGRTVLGTDRVPLYEGGLPGGGSRHPKTPKDVEADVVLFTSCIGQMFGPAEGSQGSRSATRSVLEKAGVPYTIPGNAGGLCCGTPWKSKGHLKGYHVMVERVLQALWVASRKGAIPVISDAASCTEGIEVMLSQALNDHPEYSAMKIEDATVFVAREALPNLTVRQRLSRVAVHPTCSTTSLGATGALTEIAGFTAEETYIPDDWGCCAFAGDRGMLHPELTASATESETAELVAVEQEEGAFDAYVSANRTCEIGMARATGKRYRHVLELLDEVTK